MSNMTISKNSKQTFRKCSHCGSTQNKKKNHQFKICLISQYPIPQCNQNYSNDKYHLKRLCSTSYRPVTMIVLIWASRSWWMIGVVSGFSRFSSTKNPRKVRFLSTCSLQNNEHFQFFRVWALILLLANSLYHLKII